jgi:hypothetical protein
MRGRAASHLENYKNTYQRRDDDVGSSRDYDVVRASITTPHESLSDHHPRRSSSLPAGRQAEHLEHWEDSS